MARQLSLAIPAPPGCPTWGYERRAREAGYQRIAGVDEVGRGPIAGPVVAAAVILPFECSLEGLNDSKMLAPRKRERLFDVISSVALGIGVGIVDVETIDRINILEAARQAMRQAIASMPDASPDFALVDGYPVPDFPCPHEGLVKGDRRSVSVAAASVIAKVTRDRLMDQLDGQYPGYGFARHKGYCTTEHLKHLERLGPSPLHRKSFAPVAERLNPLGG